MSHSLMRKRLIKSISEYNRIVLAISVLCGSMRSLAIVTDDEISRHLESIGFRTSMAAIKRVIRTLEHDDSVAVFRHVNTKRKMIVFLCDDDSMASLRFATSFDHYWLYSQTPGVRAKVDECRRQSS